MITDQTLKNEDNSNKIVLVHKHIVIFYGKLLRHDAFSKNIEVYHFDLVARKSDFFVCEQQRRILVCEPAQSGQRLYC